MRTHEADVRRELAGEREELVQAVEELRRSVDVRASLRSMLPLLVAGAFLSGFVLAGGIGATARLLFRRGREGRAAASLGRYTLVLHR